MDNAYRADLDLFDFPCSATFRAFSMGETHQPIAHLPLYKYEVKHTITGCSINVEATNRHEACIAAYWTPGFCRVKKIGYVE